VNKKILQDRPEKDTPISINAAASIGKPFFRVNLESDFLSPHHHLTITSPHLTSPPHRKAGFIVGGFEIVMKLFFYILDLLYGILDSRAVNCFPDWWL
jgi:hypothetical protein